MPLVIPPWLVNMIKTTVLSLLLLLAIVQGEPDSSNGTDCETAKENIERSFQVLSISTRQLGQKCREEKRDCDKKMREVAQIEAEKKKCDEKVVDLDDQIANYAASFDELGTELQKCKAEENGGSGSGCEDVENVKLELEQQKAEKENLQVELDKEKQEKETLQEEINIAKTEAENLTSSLEQVKEENSSCQIQLEEEKQLGEKHADELAKAKQASEEAGEALRVEKDHREKLEQEIQAQQANFTKLSEDFVESQRKFSELEDKFSRLESKLQICNELRAETPETLNEVENKNASEKCSRIGRDLDLIRTHAGVYYFNYNTALPWLSANDYCRSRGLELATAESAEALMEVGRVRSRGYHVAFWTSASDRGHSPGQFHWANGREVSTDLWFPGQPDQASYGREDCAYVFGSRLKDSPCSDSFYFACQVPQECVPHLR